MVAPTSAVAPPTSNGGETSTTSAPTVQPAQAADQLLGLEAGHAADLRGAGARREGRVEHVDVETHIGRPVAHHPPRFGQGRLDAQFDELFHVDHADAALAGESVVVRRIHRAANADLHRAQRVEQTFLDGPAEWRAVGVGVVAEVAVVGIGMRIEMHHAQRPLATQGAKDRQGHQVVATDRQRQGTGGMDLAIEAFDAAQRIEQVDGIHRRITEVADPHQS